MKAFVFALMFLPACPGKSIKDCEASVDTDCLDYSYNVKSNQTVEEFRFCLYDKVDNQDLVYYKDVHACNRLVPIYDEELHFCLVSTDKTEKETFARKLHIEKAVSCFKYYRGASYVY